MAIDKMIGVGVREDRNEANNVDQKFMTTTLPRRHSDYDIVRTT